MTFHVGLDVSPDGQVVLDVLVDPVGQDIRVSCHVVQVAYLAFAVQEAYHDGQEAYYAGLMACLGPWVSDLAPTLAFLPLAF